MEACNIEKAKTVADNFLKRHNYDLAELDRTVTEEDAEFIIRYELKDRQKLGGGAEFRIDKHECKIVDSKLFQ